MRASILASGAPKQYAKGQHMFDKIQRIGYLVDDLDKAVARFKHRFGAENAHGGPVSIVWPILSMPR